MPTNIRTFFQIVLIARLLAGLAAAQELPPPQLFFKDVVPLISEAGQALIKPSPEGLKKAEESYSAALEQLQGLAAQLEPHRGDPTYNAYLQMTGQYVSNAVMGMAMVYSRRGEDEKAIKLLESNIGLLARNHDAMSEGNLHKTMAESYHHLQQLQKAKVQYEKALELYAKEPKRLADFTRYARLAYYRCLEEMGDKEGAAAQLNLAVTDAEAMPMGEEKQEALKQVLFERAYLSMRQGDRRSAESDLRRMLALPVVQASPDDKMSTLISLYSSLAGSDREKERRQVLEQAGEVLATAKAAGNPVSPMLEETYYMGLASVQVADGDAAKALATIDKIDAIHQQTGMGGLSPAFQSKLNIYQTQGRMSELLPQLKAYLESVTNPTNEDLQLFLTLARALSAEGQVEEALDRVKAVETLAEQSGAKALLLDAVTLEGDIFSDYDQSDRAQERYTVAVELSRQLGREESTRSLRSRLFHLELGKPNYLQDKAQVQKDFEQLSQSLSTGTVGTIEVTSVFSSYVKELIEQKDYPRAADTIAFLKKNLGGRSPFVDLYISVMEGKINRKLGRLEDGDKEIARLESDLQKTQDVRFQRRILEEIIDWKMDLGRKLEGDATMAAIAALPGQQEQIDDRLSNLLFDIHVAEYEGRNEDVMKKAGMAESLLLSVRQGGGSQELGTAFVTTANRIYQVLVARLVLDGHPDEAFAAAERGRGVTLSSLFSRSEANVALKATTEEKKQLDRLYSTRDALEKRLASETGSEAEKTMTDLSTTAGQIDSLLTTIAGRDSGAEKLFVGSVSADYVREHLKPGQALVRFFTGPDRSYVFMLQSSGATQVAELPGNEALMDQVREYRLAIQLQSPRAKKFGADLSQTLFGGLTGLEGFEEIVVVPDGPLFLLPFSPLKLKDGRELYNHAVSVLPSAKSMAYLKAPRAVTAGGTVTVFANPAYGSGDDSRVAIATGTARVGSNGRPVELPGTAREAELVKKLCEPKHQVNVYERAEASRGRLEDLNRSGRLEKSRVLHFATHGFMVPENPRLSGLILSLVDDEGRPKNGYLRLLDIYDLHLDADLVVLSACETGKGTIKEGDGLLGLYQGFLTAGGRQVLNTLWSIDDEGTAVFFGYFYEAMMGGKSAKEALALAQQRMAHSDRWSSPYYWAAFQLVSK